MKYFTEVTNELLKEIEEKSNILWKMKQKSTEYDCVENFIGLLMCEKCLMTHDSFNGFIKCEYIPLTSEQFIEKCIELNPKKKGKWVPGIDERYWYMTSGGGVATTCNTEHEVDEYRIKTNEAFKTKEIYELSKALKIAKAEYENAVDEFNGDWEPDYLSELEQSRFKLTIRYNNVYAEDCGIAISSEIKYLKSNPKDAYEWGELKCLYKNYFNAKTAFEKAKREV